MIADVLEWLNCQNKRVCPPHVVLKSCLFKFLWSHELDKKPLKTSSHLLLSLSFLSHPQALVGLAAGDA